MAAFSRTGEPIKFNAAVAMAALGLAVTVLAVPQPGRWAQRCGSVLAAVAVAVAVATGVEYVSGGFPYIDELLIRDRYAGVHPPGRIGLMAMVGVSLLGSGLLLRDARRPGLRRMGQGCLLAAGMVGLLAAVGHLYDVAPLTGYGPNLFAIAYPAVAGLLIASVGALAGRPRQGAVGVVLSGHPGGVAARTLLPAAVGVPLVLGWLRHLSEQHALVEARLSTAMLVVSTVGCLAAVVIWLAGALNRADAQLRQEIEARTAAQAAAAASNDELNVRNELLARSNQALDRANADLRGLAAIVQSSDDAIIGKTLDGTITSWNPAAHRLYGYTPQEAIGENITIIVPPDRVAELPALLARVARGEHIEHHETQRVHKDGRVLDVSVSIAPTFDETGAVTGVSTIAHDITARKAAEAHERVLRDRLQTAERLESLGQLAGGVAHDFNNVLAIIGNYATFIAEQTPSDSTIHADAAQIITSAARGAALADQLMVFARTEPAQVAVFDLNTMLTDVRDLLARTLGEHIHLVVSTATVALPVRADPARIQQVLLNMAFNARDAMPEGGTLVLEAVPIDFDDPSLSPSLGLDPGRYARLLVSDTGIGMPPEVAARAFEPFFTTKPKGKGTGLGLATTYGTITQLGGSIKIHSEPELGTTLCVYLPLSEQPSDPPATKPAAEPPRGQGQTVLAVDDEAAIRRLVARILETHGYTAVVAESGLHALNLARQQPVDLLLTDIIMPEMNGGDLADTLRRHHPGLPVIYMSGYSDGLLSAQRLLTDSTRLIQKPFTARELLHTVHTLLTQARAIRP
jgi:PAS domain S-box-containing protein